MHVSCDVDPFYCSPLRKRREQCEPEIEDWNVPVKPEAMETLCQKSMFSRRELQRMYRSFKQDCPSGVIREEKFKAIYSQFFPRGADIQRYAHYVFAAFDTKHSGVLTFTDLVVGLSILTRGSLRDKLKWTFFLYDVDQDGILSREEMRRIVSSIYDLLGRGRSTDHREVARRTADETFDKLDANGDGVITMNEFMDSCLQDKNIIRSLTHFNTLI